MAKRSKSARKPRVLVADDKADVLAAARLLFKSEGIYCQTVSNPQAALELIDDQEFDLAMLDLNYSRDTTSGKEGHDLVAKIREKYPDLPIVVMTAWATVDIAVNAMRLGANDFITKPWENDRLLSIVANLYALSQSREREMRLQEENSILREDKENTEFVADSAAMREVLETARQVAPSDASILITGENGTGKSMLANLVHKGSLRSEESFISVNMGGLPETLFEGELFGHVKGAFTDAKEDRIGRYELADGGTLFLDEIGELSASQQTRLLRLLETGEFERLGSSQTRKADVRIVSATNADLEEKVQKGFFRQDLYYRLNTVTIEMPPLRERLADIKPLAHMFLRNFAKRYKRSISAFSDEAIALLERHPWPGNIRELAHAIERSVLMAKTDRIEATSLGLSASSDRGRSLDDMSLEEVESYLIQRALERHEGNANQAAQALGLSRSAFYRRLQKNGL